MLSVVFSLVLAALLRWYKTLFAVGFIFVFWIIYTSLQGPFALKRSMPGSLARLVVGKVGAVQWVDDLVDEVNQPATAAALRSWAASVLAAQREREIPPASVSYPWLLPCVEATDIAPPQVLVHYRPVLSQRPETYLYVDATGRVAGVILSWAHLRLGLVVLPDGRAPALQGTFYERQPAQDIRVFSTQS
jgi:hypothetical protein